ncbi:MAG: biotin/lipoyl-binding protein, partial [Paracoccaceae bacterium]
MAKPTPEDRAVPIVRAAGLSPEAGGPRLPVVRPPDSAQVEDPARPRRRVWIWAVGLLLAGGIGIGLWLQPWLATPVHVAVEIISPEPVTRLLAVNGRIAALQSVDVRALVSGTLVDLSVAEGDGVEQGAVIARIDAAAQQAMLRQAVAGLDAALVAQGQAQDTLSRTEALGGNVARTALDGAARAVQSAAQEVARTTALVEQAQVQLGHYTIRAPISGTVLALDVARGQSIDPSIPMMTIADLQ